MPRLPRWILVAMFAAVISSGGAACVPPAPQVTPSGQNGAAPDQASWRTYRDGQHRFEFRYPGSCDVSELNGSILTSFHFTD